jgi:site-specific DNA recombinase
MDRVRDLVAAGGVTVVLAQDRDRIAREPAYHYHLRREFEEYGTRIRAMNDRGDDSPEGELTNAILDQLAKFERAKTTERSRKEKLRKAREGKMICGHTPGYGFRYTDARWLRGEAAQHGRGPAYLLPDRRRRRSPLRHRAYPGARGHPFAVG